MGDPERPNTTRRRAGARRPRLGRGLQAMIEPGPGVEVPDTSAPATETHRSVESGSAQNTPDGSGGGAATPSAGVREIPCDAIVPNPHQPRRDFDDAALASLAASIEAHGVLQPITVRGSDVGQGRYELIAGERRWRAFQRLGLASIPAIVREADDPVSAQLALIENIQREDLDPIERASALRDLSARHGMTQEQIANTVGVSRSSVANAVRLLDLPAPVIEMIRSGELSVGHAKVLGSRGDPHEIEALARRAIERGWNVRALEREMRKNTTSASDAGSTPGSGGGGPRAADVLRDLERRLGESLGTAVKVRTSGDGTKGRVEIAFYDLDQFDGLLRRMGVDERS